VDESVGAHEPVPVLDAGTTPLEPSTADRLVKRVLSCSSAPGSDGYRPDVVSRGLARYVAVAPDWTVTEWDPRLHPQTGVGPAKAIGESLWDVVPSWEGSSLSRLLRQAMNRREPAVDEVCHRPSDRWLLVRTVPASTGGLELFLRDVTTARRAQHQLDAARRRLDNTLERITDAFFTLDEDERFVYLNSRAESLLRVDAESVRGSRFWDVFPAAAGTSFYDGFSRALDSQESASFEVYYQPLDAWFEVNAYPSTDGLSVFLQDVTERVSLTNDLKSLHDRTDDLISAESATDVGEAAVDAAVEVLDRDLTVLWEYDRAAEQLEPLARSDAVAERIEEPPVIQRGETMVWDAFVDQEPHNPAFVPLRTADSHHPGEVNSELLVPLDEYGVMAVYADERRAFDETDADLFRILGNTVASALARVRRERQLARRNGRLNEFASIVSHDLRNPMQVAAARTELARETGDTDHLDVVLESLDRMDTLVEDLLARAHGEDRFDIETVALAHVAREAWRGVETADATLDVETEARLAADADRLQQVFENLFRNAIEHAGRDVTVTVGTVEEGFYVADDGPGVPEGTEIFEQGVSGAKDGTGYGLAIVADIVERHGWSVDAVNDDGARFVVSGVCTLDTDACRSSDPEEPKGRPGA
jgi:PAS domain S-box-containing protein